MNADTLRMRGACFACAAAFALAAAAGLDAQGRGGRQGGPQAPATPQASAPIDLTGYWVPVITEDWRHRMVTPAKGDFPNVPLNQEGFKLAMAWDPAKDEAAGEQCRSYGAPAIMRTPTRLRISWMDANTLKLETDYGIQTRLFRFDGKVASGAPSWQGYSVARWNVARRGRGGNAAAAGGSLQVMTTNLRPGYLRKNGVPYSASTVLREYWNVTTSKTGDTWLVVTSEVDDPTYLQLPFVTSIHFKKEPDGSKWDPTPCNTRW
jgi:hypothetical protein